MTMYSRKTEISMSGIMAGGHPPITHNMALAEGWEDIAAGVVVVVTADGILAWDGSTDADVTPGVDPDPATVAIPKLGIALNTPLEDDASALCLLHGCYRKSAVTVGGIGLTEAQSIALMGSGLYPEDSWGS